MRSNANLLEIPRLRTLLRVLGGAGNTISPFWWLLVNYMRFISGDLICYSFSVFVSLFTRHATSNHHHNHRDPALFPWPLVRGQSPLVVEAQHTVSRVPESLEYCLGRLRLRTSFGGFAPSRPCEWQVDLSSAMTGSYDRLRFELRHFKHQEGRRQTPLFWENQHLKTSTASTKSKTKTS